MYTYDDLMSKYSKSYTNKVITMILLYLEKKYFNLLSPILRKNIIFVYYVSI